MTGADLRPAAAADRDGGQSVEVRGARGDFLFSCTPSEAVAVVARGVGRLVAAGRVLRVGRAANRGGCLAEDDFTTGGHRIEAQEHIARRCAAYDRQREVDRGITE